MSLDKRLLDLKQDLLSPSGPSISTNQNYPFALFQYLPQEEFTLREKLVDLMDALRNEGWTILHIDLLETLLGFLSKEEDGELISVLIEEEKRQYKAHKGNFTQPLKVLENSLDIYFKAEDGYPQTVLSKIEELNERKKPKSLIFLSRIGALYPFYRTSSLLRYIDKGIRIPTIVLYPGERLEKYYLSFMGEMDADRDYRPRIY